MRQFWKCMVILLSTLIITIQINAQNYKTLLTQIYENPNNGVTNSDSLNIDDAVMIALKNNREIRGILLDSKAFEQITYQQALNPNPQFSLDAENIFGSGNFNGFNGSEITAAFSQDILLAGKLSKLKNVNELETNIAYLDYEIKRLEILTKVRKAFNDVIKIQTLFVKQGELLQNTNSFVQNVKRRSEKGAVSSIEVLRASLVYNKLELDKISTEQRLKSMKKNLAVLMGIDKITANKLIIENNVIKLLPKLEKLIELQKLNPRISKHKIIEEQGEAKIEYQKSLAVPDITLAAGFRRMNESETNTFLVGFSIPLPVFNDNQGNISIADIRLDQNRIRMYATIKNMETKLTELYNNAVNYQYSLTAYKETLLPQAKEVLESIKQGYDQGRYKILDVINSQNTLIDIEINYIEVQNAYLNTICDIENEIAASIENVN